MHADKAPIFALDIGTRSIVGVLAHHQDGKLEIIDCEIREHLERSVQDGQIHDVEKVAEVIQKIKKELESRNQVQLKQVSVAAAGRSLKTMRIKSSRSIREHSFGSRDEVIAFELEAVQDAQRQLVEENEYSKIDHTKFHCVGYSVVEYSIDGSPIGSIVDQFGEEATIDVIATFLPRIVIDSLQASLSRADLEIAALTLEPIAAINVLIPPTMRRLNIALVDVGAGTSDIALTAEGTITAYAMVPTAGDEVTEALSENYLLDFNVAEALKRSLVAPEVSFQDILGFDHSRPSEEVIESIRPVVQNLAQKIADRILEYNKKAPQAVMLIGGGSMTPLLTAELASRLDIPVDRVAVRGAEALQNIIGSHEVLKGPESVTPVGIAMAAINNHISHINVFVNNKQVRVFDFKKLLIGDALIAAGIDMNKLHGKPGMALSVDVNGRCRIVRGTMGTPAKLFLDNQPVSLDTPIEDGAQIITTSGELGLDASATIRDIVTEDETKPLQIKFNGKDMTLDVLIQKNGLPASLDDELSDRDQLIIHPPSTVKEVVLACGVDESSIRDQNLTIFLPDQTKTFKTGASVIYHNGQPAQLYTRVQNNDKIEIKENEQGRITLASVIDPDELFGYQVDVQVNGQAVTMINPSIKLLVNGEESTPDRVLANNDRIEIDTKNRMIIIFNDIFNYVDIMSEKPEDKTKLEMRLNNEEAKYNTPLKNGDIIHLAWV